MKKTAEFFEFIANMDEDLVEDIRLLHHDGRTPIEIARELASGGALPPISEDMLVGFIFGVIATIDGIDK